jgi:hypothetical protein
MKKDHSYINRLVALGTAVVVMAWASTLCAQSSYQGAAKVVRIKGVARYTTDNKNWLPLKAGDVIKAGAVVQTASSSQVDLLLTDREEAGPEPALGTVGYRPEAETRANVVRMSENTVLGLDKLSWMDTGVGLVTETQLDLRAGRIFGTVKKLSGASKYEVKIPNGVAGIRGTIYTLDSTGVLKVLTGSVVLAYVKSDGTVVTQVVMAGQMFDPATGLVTPIPAYSENEMVKAAEEMGLARVAPTTYAVDHTIYYVSPTVGMGD